MADGRTDAELMGLVAAGDREAYDVLYGRHASVMVGLASHSIRVEDAEDLVNDIWCWVWAHADRYCKERGTVVRWLYGAMKNRLNSRLRSIYAVRKQFSVVSIDNSDLDVASPFSEENAPAIDTLQKLAIVIQSLSQKDRRLVELKYVEKKASAEIAKLLKLPTPNAVDNQLTRLKKKIRKKILEGTHTREDCDEN